MKSGISAPDLDRLIEALPVIHSRKAIKQGFMAPQPLNFACDSQENHVRLSACVLLL